MKKKLLIVLSCILLIAIGCTAYIVSGDMVRRKYTLAYLESKGYSDLEIQNIQVEHSFLGGIASLGEWLIAVEFADEPGVLYYYNYKSKSEISQGGIGGSAAIDKEALKHAER